MKMWKRKSFEGENMELNNNRMKILKEIKQPTTIKALQERTGINWANLSKHIKVLDKQGFILLLGREGKSKVIQSNKLNIKNYIEAEIDRLQSQKKELI